MGVRRIIAPDPGKFKTAACVMDAADRSHVFETAGMSPDAVHDLLARHATDDPGEALVVFETRDCYHPPRPAPAAGHAGRIGVGRLASQPPGPGVGGQGQPRQ